MSLLGREENRSCCFYTASQSSGKTCHMFAPNPKGKLNMFLYDKTAFEIYGPLLMSCCTCLDYGIDFRLHYSSLKPQLTLYHLAHVYHPQGWPEASLELVATGMRPQRLSGTVRRSISQANVQCRGQDEPELN